MVSTINITLNIGALGIAMLLLILTISAGNLKKRIYLYFFLNILANLMGMLCDDAVGLMAGQTGPVIDASIRIINCFAFCSGGLQFIAFSLYLYEYLSIKTTVSKKPFHFMLILSLMSIVLAIADSFFGLYGTFDAANNYIQQDTYWISAILPMVALTVWFSITVRYIKVLRAREWVALLSYAVVPFLCFWIEAMVPGLFIASVGGTVTTFLIYMNIQVDLKNQMRLKEAELTENRIAIMLSQIQPHFLYNALNTIDDLFYHDSEKAHKAMYMFAHYLRGNMDSLTQKEPILFSKELEHTREYLSLEKLRFEEDLNVVYDITADHFKLPVLTLQPIVENAVRYGVTKKEAGGTIVIRTEEDDKHYRIIVEDDGVGFDTANPPNQDGRSHMGILNVRNRLAAMCGGTLTVTSTIGVGTTAVMEIPK